MDYASIIDKYYFDNATARDILLQHSQSVTLKALQIVALHPELNANRQFVEEAAMLHDIGIVRCNAPSIGCFGDEPYIRHGIIGAELLRAEGFPRHAGVCERHTGAGLSREDIESQDLPLPHRDFIPQTVEEEIICYADKFFSKTGLGREKTFEEAKRSIAKFGNEGLQRFLAWSERFGQR